MAGGMSHLDTLDPKTDRSVRGPVNSIRASGSGIRMSEYLPGLSRRMDRLAIIRSLSSTQGAHEEGRYFMHSSYTKRGTIQHPGMGSWLVKLDGARNPNLPGVVHIGSANPGGGNGFFEQKYAPLVIGNPEAGLQNSKIRKGFTKKEFEDSVMLTNAFDAEFHRKYDQKKTRAYTDMYDDAIKLMNSCLLYTSPSQRDGLLYRMTSSA